MRDRRLVGAIFTLLAACSSGEDPTGTTVVDDTGIQNNGDCDTSHHVDGAFSSWPAAPGCFEWSEVVPHLRSDQDTYVDYQDKRLWLLLDLAPGWSGGDIALVTQQGQEQWTISADLTGYWNVTRNGQPFDQDVEVVVGVGASPRRPEAHPIVEVALPAGPGAFWLLRLPGSDGDMPAGPVSGSIDDDVTTRTPFGPRLLSIEAAKGITGDAVVLHGTGFGASSSTVRFGGLPASVTAWTDTRIDAVVPTIDASVPVLVELGPGSGQTSNSLMFFWDCERGCSGAACASCDPGPWCGVCPDQQPTCVDGECTCIPECDNRNCGPDACGGICGVCAPLEQCVAGQCLCAPQCKFHPIKTACGSDSCGSVCGSCSGPGGTCLDGLCCSPDCAGKQCGGNSCGGICGTCPADFPCTNGVCTCKPYCVGLNCGPNGCGGTCGQCLGAHICVEGKCTCVPSCINEFGGQMNCGDDGCGGSCGTCKLSEECTKIGVCAPAE